jgi:hypothetical protein
MALNRYIIKSSRVGALGGFLFGFDTAVIAGSTLALTHMFRLSPTELGSRLPPPWHLSPAVRLFGWVPQPL